MSSIEQRAGDRRNSATGEANRGSHNGGATDESSDFEGGRAPGSSAGTPDSSKATGGPGSNGRRGKKRRRPLLAALVVLVLAAAAVVIWRVNVAGAETDQGADISRGSFAGRFAAGAEGGLPVSGELYLAESVQNREGVEVSGNIAPGQAVDLSAKVAGTIISGDLREGQAVRAGQVLFAFDNADLEYQIAAKEYEIEQERLSGSPRKLALLQMQYELLLAQRTDYTVRASISGRLSAVEADLGDEVTKGQNLGRIIDTSTLSASVNVDELDVPRVQLGQEVEVYLDALEGVSLFGTVTKIGLEGSATGNGYATVPVEIRFDEPDPRIVPGFSFSGNIYVSGEEEAVVVDKRAVQTLTDTMAIVFQVGEDGETATPVQVGYESFGQLQYKISGVEPGARLMEPPAALTGSEGPGGFPGASGGFGGPSIRVQPLGGPTGAVPGGRTFRSTGN